MIFRNPEQKIIEALKNEDNGSYSMRVVGRGTLVMSAKAIRESKKYQELSEKMRKIVVSDKEKS